MQSNSKSVDYGMAKSRRRSWSDPDTHGCVGCSERIGGEFGLRVTFA